MELPFKKGNKNSFVVLVHEQNNRQKPQGIFNKPRNEKGDQALIVSGFFYCLNLP